MFKKSIFLTYGQEHIEKDGREKEERKQNEWLDHNAIRDYPFSSFNSDPFFEIN